MLTRVFSRDNKGRFCSPTSEALKSMSILIDRVKQELDEEALIHILDVFYRTNVKFVEENNSVYCYRTSKKRNIKYKIKEPSINYTVIWEAI